MVKNSSNLTLITKLVILVVLILGCFSQTTLAQTTNSDRPGVIEKKITQGSKVVIDNRFGDLTIVGWDQSDLQAVSDEIPLNIREEGNKFILSALEPNRHKGFDMSVKVPKNIDLEIINRRSGDIRIENVNGSTTIAMNSGDISVYKVGMLDLSLFSGDIHIEQAGITNIKLKKGDVFLADASGAVNITNFSGDIAVKNVQGNLTCRSTSGDISAETITGLVNISLSSGEARLSNLSSDLLISAINGEINAQCVKGRVEINNANGSIELGNVTDDVQVVTVSGDITLESLINSKGRYSLKTTSGDISFLMQDNPPGFRADMFCYEGDIDTNIELKIENGHKTKVDPIDPVDPVDPPSPPSPPNPKPVTPRKPVVNSKNNIHGQENFIGRYGDGQAQIKLSTFTGDITLSKGHKASSSQCK